jgi:hypothetical protein
LSLVKNRIMKIEVKIIGTECDSFKVYAIIYFLDREEQFIHVGAESRVCNFLDALMIRTEMLDYFDDDSILNSILEKAKLRNEV